MSLIKLALLSLGMLLLFFIVLFLTKTISRFLNLNRADSITVMFCGSKKSLVHGTVMAGVLFAGNPITGYILLPLMLYHALQLIASSILAKKMALNN
jgi:solute carrier family 10 (sodium/bile acid cotransporter), member 7